VPSDIRNRKSVDEVDSALDAIDQRILRALQRDSSIANQALANAVGLSPPACLKRAQVRLGPVAIPGVAGGFVRRFLYPSVTQITTARLQRYQLPPPRSEPRQVAWNGSASSPRHGRG
jgi:hypothetical protein